MGVSGVDISLLLRGQGRHETFAVSETVSVMAPSHCA